LILVTGGAGFIGSNFVLDWLVAGNSPVVNLDKLTYAGNPNNLASLKNHDGHFFIRGDIYDRSLVRSLILKYRPWAIVHFAAESHVDRSIIGPADFIQTNVVGTFHLLEEARSYWQGVPDADKKLFRFVHVSTDEVYGALESDDPPFRENSRYAPSSPYAASKAGADHLVRAYYHTYDLPVLIVNCSNNFGPRQFPEKLIPLMIHNALQGKPLPVYGDGLHVRDWLYVSDHCEAIRAVLEKGKAGETYNIGGNNQRTNLEVVKTICSILDELKPGSPFVPHANLITMIKDRPGHDRRYAIDAGKIERELQWKPRENFESAIRKTIQWYLDNPAWIKDATSSAYQSWIASNYGNRELI